jgi:uncharacterized MnhB-related membrane protein
MDSREIITIILLILLIVCAVAVNLTGNLLQAVIIFMAYSFMMSVVWILMESPDLGITEAAVGAGVSGTLFLMTLKKIRKEDEVDPSDRREEHKLQNEKNAKSSSGKKRRTGR